MKRKLGWNRGYIYMKTTLQTYKDWDVKRERLDAVSGVYMSLSHMRCTNCGNNEHFKDACIAS